jgi:hypothetical protein
MKRLLATVLAGGAGLLAVSAALAQDTNTQADPNKTYDLKAKYSVGDLLSYKMQMDMNMEMKGQNGSSPFPGGKMEMSSDVRYKTVGIRPDGTAVIVMQTQNGKGTMAGNALPVPETPPITMEIDSRGIGKVRGMENVPGGQALSQMFNMNRVPTMGVVLPDHPVKVGDTWNAEIPSPMGAIKIDCTLLGTEPVGGKETLRVKMTTTMPLDMKMGAGGKPVTEAEQAMMVMTGNAITNSILNILPDNARLVKMAGDMSTNMKMEIKGEAASQSPFGSEMNMKVDGKMSMNLVSAGRVPASPVPAKSVKKKSRA